MKPPPRLPSHQQGAALMEALVSMLIVAFGVLGFVGLQARTAVSNLEGYQRAQALVLVADMSQRISLNRKNAAAYAGQGEWGTGLTLETCTATPGAARDLCEWGNLLRGSADLTSAGTSEVGAMINPRGCIEATGTLNEYLVSVVWQGVQATGDTTLTCGAAATTYPAGLRRGVSTLVRIATLS